MLSFKDPRVLAAIAAVVVLIIIIIVVKKEKFTGCGGANNSCSGSTYSSGNAPPGSGNAVQLGGSQAGIATPNSILSADATGNITLAINVPIGAIMMWPDPTNIPAGWHLCDGTAPASNPALVTPNMCGRFPVGAGGMSSGLSQYAAGDIGGEEMHTLSQGEMPAHQHSSRAESCSGSTCGESGGGFQWGGGSFAVDRQTSVMGGNMPHNTLPPYFGVAFIMKVSY